MQNNNSIPSNNDQGDDKTIIFSSTENTAGKKDEAEKISKSDDNEKTQIQDSPAPKSNSADSKANNENVPNKLADLNSKKTDSKISPGLFAAGVAGAAIGGTALGTAFSDEIKEVFNVESFNAPDSPEAEAQEVNSSQISDIATDTLQGADSNIHPTAFHSDSSIEHPDTLTSDHVSSFEISSTDTAGNTYTVSMVDIDGDGDVDSQSGHIQLVDGSSVSFTQTGDNLNPLFGHNAEIASVNDFHGNPAFAAYNPLPENDTHVYEIQAGDTLSEIAEANNTSVAHLMELNPDITDPNLIYASHNLVIPNNDNISNPYEGGVGPEGHVNNIVESNDSTVTGDSLAGDASEGDYANVDWASFSDDAANADNSAYGEALSQTDFDSFEAPESYNDFDSNDLDNLDISADFM